MVDTLDEGSKQLVMSGRGAYKRSSLEEARKSAGALLEMKFVFASET